MSSGRSRNAGSRMGKTFSRYYKSDRNCFSSIIDFKSRFRVSQICDESERQARVDCHFPAVSIGGQMTCVRNQNGSVWIELHADASDEPAVLAANNLSV